MKRHGRATDNQRGVTLIEMLTAITILSIVSVGVSLLYTQALKMYQQGTREATSRDKAALALQRMTGDIREAFNVDYPGPGIIVFTMPERGADGHYEVDSDSKTLVAGKQVALLQGDINTNYDKSGEYIWRLERPDTDSSWEIIGIVMDDVEDLSFTYSPSTELLELVRVAVTVGQGEHPGYYNRTEIAEVWIRNH